MGVRSGGVSAKRERNQRQGLLIRPRPNAVRPVHTHRVAQAVGQKRHQHGVLLRELDAEGADGLDDDNLKLVGDFVHKVLNLPHEAVDAGLGARLRKGVQGRRLNVGGGVTGQTWGRMCPQLSSILAAGTLGTFLCHRASLHQSHRLLGTSPGDSPCKRRRRGCRKIFQRCKPSIYLRCRARFLLFPGR